MTERYVSLDDLNRLHYTRILAIEEVAKLEGAKIEIKEWLHEAPPWIHQEYARYHEDVIKGQAYEIAMNGFDGIKNQPTFDVYMWLRSVYQTPTEIADKFEWSEKMARTADIIRSLKDIVNLVGDGVRITSSEQFNNDPDKFRITYNARPLARRNALNIISGIVNPVDDRFMSGSASVRIAEFCTADIPKHVRIALNSARWAIKKSQAVVRGRLFGNIDTMLGTSPSEWPEDEWINVGERWSLNLHNSGRDDYATLYPVKDGSTDTKYHIVVDRIDRLG